jgi:predicted adenylyl cyclase CyaB
MIIMLEKEIKILEIDGQEVAKKLLDLWAVQTFDWFIHDIYYDFVSWEAKKMESNKRLFRVRQKWETHLYTIKRKRTTEAEWWEKWVKIADEWENPITDIDSFKNVLEKYWMKKVREKKKHRTSFSLWELEFDIDDYDGIPTLLEIEAKTKKELDNMVKLLWLEKNSQKTFGSRGLYKYYWLDYSYL